MIVAEMRARHVPMEVLGLEIQREYVRQKHRQIGRDFTNRFFRKSGGSRERRFLQHVSDLVDRWLGVFSWKQMAICMPRDSL